MNIPRAVAAPIAAFAILAGVAGTATAAPQHGPAELQGKLQAALNGNGAELESGNAGNIAVVRTRVTQIPGYHWDISGPVTVNGPTLNATLHSRLGGYDYPVPMQWKLINDTWKLSKQSEDTLVGMANLKY